MTRLFVGNLSLEVTQGDLREAFAAYGPVSSADIVVDKSNGRSRGFGFIAMPLEADAAAAIQGLDRTDLKGQSLNVSRARPRSEGSDRGSAPRGWAVVGDARNRW
jgi:RNA recognition motif-containing protein